MPPVLELVQLCKSFGSYHAVVGLDLTVAKGEFVALLGPSGCGKTTTLRMVAGYLAPTSGQVLLEGKDATALPPEKRNIGMVFQSYALFPHMTVAENVAFGLAMRKTPAGETQQRVAEALELIGLSDLAGRFPRELSGGQQQRVALARAIVIRPSVLLLDEPLSNLDARLRQQMRVELKRVQREVGLTTILVTHDQEEALGLADHVVLLNRGALEQAGSPRAIFQHPQSRFVADFLGFENFLTLPELGPVTIRPEYVEVLPAATPLSRAGRAGGPGQTLTATVTASTFRGADSVLSLQTGVGGLRAIVPGDSWAEGDPATVFLPLERLIQLDH